MNYENFFFFFFSSIALTSAIFVIYSINTIYSVFFLILVFVNITGILLILKIEFISIMLIIIYVGAITVLFLFIVMMLDINLKFKLKNFGYIPIIFLISTLFCIETFLMFSKIFTSYYNNIEFWYKLKKNNLWIYRIDNITNIETIGQVLYTFYFFFFFFSGIILLISLIGAVILTKKENVFIKDINILYTQLSRNYKKAIFNIKK